MSAFFAGLPILLVLSLMLAGQGSTRAGPAGWALALLLAASAYGTGAELLFWSQVKGLMLSLWVLYIVWAALFLYQVVREAGGFDAVAAAVSGVSADPGLQRLMLAWVFASFLQGVTGFGVPVAVVAPLMVGLGVAPLEAVVASSIGHAWAVSFGSVGSSIYAMLAVTGLPPEAVAPTSAAMLGAMGMLSGLLVLAGAGRAATLRCLPALLLVGGTMAGVHSLLAASAAWPLASFGAGAAGLLACLLASRLPWHRRLRPSEARPFPADGGGPALGIVWASLPYLLLTLFVLVFRILLPDLLDFAELRIPTPATGTAQGWVNEAGHAKGISILGHTGALIAYAALASQFCFSRRRGRRAAPESSPGLGTLFRRSLRAAGKPAYSIVFLVGMAQILADAGMTDALAKALAEEAGASVAFLSPFLGALGAFVTGSNTNANVLFSGLELQAAELLGLEPAVVLAGQNVGGALGSVLSPAKLVVALSTVGLVGAESAALRRLLVQACGLLLIFGLVTWWLA